MSNHNLTFSAALAVALADNGVTDACISPGSRNTPLIAGFAAETRITKWPILDERSAGFFGVGAARATGNPVVLICTSGTAATEYHAAVVEACQDYVPLIVLTADRPPELRGIGAPQSIDQVSLYGSSPLLFRDIPPPDDDIAPDPRVLAAEIVGAARGLPRGPVHVNLPFREPLLTGEVATHPDRFGPSGTAQPAAPQQQGLADAITGKKGIIVAGRSIEREFPEAVAQLAATTGFPILGDPLSGTRHGRHARDLVVGHGDLLAAAGILDTLRPEVVVRLGPIPTSKPLWQWLESHPDVPQILAEPSGHDATGSAAVTITASPSVVAASLATQSGGSAPSDWASSWKHADLVAETAARRELDRAPFPNEPAIARTVINSCPPQTALTVASSMPIRDIDSFGGTTSQPIDIYGNRGTNGIDGLVSAALGSAASGCPAVALVGDVSMFHDLNALGTMAQLALPLTVVVVNNNGGGIFHFLPHADPTVMDPATFETYLGTPHGTDFVAVAEALGIEAHHVETRERLASLLSEPETGPRLLELRTDRDRNVELHRSVAAAVGEALRQP